MTSSHKKFIALACLLSVFSLFIISDKSLGQQEQGRSAERNAQIQVSILPPQVKQNWTSYVQKRLSEQVMREGRNLKVLNTAYIGIKPSYVYVSINTPYRVMCEDEMLLGLSISFGADEESNVVTHLTGIFANNQKDEPELNVPPHSIGVQSLNATLCALAAVRRQGILDTEHKNIRCASGSLVSF